MERKDDAALYKNQELSALIVALGLGTKGGGSSSNKKGRASSRGGSPAASSSMDDGTAMGSLEEGEQQEGEAGAAGDGSGGVLKGLRWVGVGGGVFCVMAASKLVYVYVE